LSLQAQGSLIKHTSLDILQEGFEILWTCSLCDSPAARGKFGFGVMGVTFLCFQQFSSAKSSSPCHSLFSACNSSWHQRCTVALSILASSQHALMLALTHAQPQVCLSIACANR